MIDYLPIVLTGLGLTASILYYTMTLRNANKTQQQQLETRKAQLFMGLYDSYIKDDFWKHLMYVNYMSWENLEEAYKKYNYQANPEAMVSVNSVAAYFNGVGVLISQGLIDIELVDELLSSIIILQWEKLEPIINDMRLKTNSPQLHTNFETLYKEIKKKHTQ